MSNVYVKLLVDVAEGGRDLAKACEAADAFGLGKNDPKYPRLKVTHTRRGTVEYRKGLVVCMNHDGAAKWVERGIAEVTTAPEEEMVEVEVMEWNDEAMKTVPTKKMVTRSTAEKLAAMKAK